MREERETPRRDLGPQLEAGMLTSSPSREVQAGQEAPVRVPSTEEATEAGGGSAVPQEPVASVPADAGRAGLPRSRSRAGSLGLMGSQRGDRTVHLSNLPKEPGNSGLGLGSSLLPGPS